MNYTAAEIVKVMHTKVVDMSELVVLLAELARDKWCTARWNKSSVDLYIILRAILWGYRMAKNTLLYMPIYAK